MKFKALTGSVLIGGLLSIAVMGLSGCVASANIDPHLTDSASNSRSSPQPSKTAKTPAAPVVKVGETIPPADVAAIQAKSADTGYYPYKLGDGSFVMTSNKQDASEVVKQDIGALAAPIAASLATVSGAGQAGRAARSAITSLALTKSAELGKRVIVVFPTQSQNVDESWTLVWATLSSENSSTGIAVGKKDATVAAANAWAQKYDGIVVVVG